MNNMSYQEMIANFLHNDRNPMISNRYREIENLKAQFKETDYQTTKNIQYEKMGRELPYKWEEIDAKAEDLRKKINEKEDELAHLLSL